MAFAQRVEDKPLVPLCGSKLRDRVFVRAASPIGEGEEKQLVEGIATSTHLYNKIFTMSYNYILKRIHTYRQQILKENKETCCSPNQIIRY